MEITGRYQIPAPRETVWAALNDPTILKECIPGCRSLEKLSDTAMAATVEAKVGPVKATFKGNVILSNINPPQSYTISGEGKGGVAGFAKGGADVALTEQDGGTLLTYTAKAQVGGKLAQIGARLIDATAKQMADQFFGTFAAKVGGEGLVARAEHAVEGAAREIGEVAHRAEERAETAAARGFLGGPQVWAMIALVVAVLLLLVLNRPG
ncbi:MAG: carbon monoxide dehydrogenase subunit G [Bauldia sp.]